MNLACLPPKGGAAVHPTVSAMTADNSAVIRSRTSVKYDWFRRTMVALYETRQHWKSDFADNLIDASDKPDWYFDWQPVIRYLAPEVLVVMSDDTRRRDVDIAIPTYLIFTEDGDWITVDVEQLDLASTDEDAEPPGQGFEQALFMMETNISSVEEQRRGEVMRHIRALRRILRLTA